MIYFYIIIIFILLYLQYEIGNEGSKVFVNESQWIAINNKTTYTSMAIALTLALFPIDVLLKSNLKGGASKVSKDDVHFSALDENKIRALKREYFFFFFKKKIKKKNIKYIIY